MPRSREKIEKKKKTEAGLQFRVGHIGNQYPIITSCR